MEGQMELVRDLLLSIAQDADLDGRRFKRVDYSVPACRNEIREHLILLINAGFVNGKFIGDSMPMISGLTWQGYELLDDIRPAETPRFSKPLEGLK